MTEPQLRPGYATFMAAYGAGLTPEGWLALTEAQSPYYPKLARTLSGGAVIVVKHSAEAAPAPHRPFTTSETATGENEQIADALMISLAMIVRHELLDGCPQRGLAGGHATTTESANVVCRNDSASNVHP